MSAPLRLATVTSPEYLLGTRVMLDSFLAENPWFAGEIVVIHDRLDEAQVRQLEQQFAGLTCHRPGAVFAGAVDSLCRAVPKLAGRRDRFLSLEVMLLDGGGPLLFLDSDLVVCGSLESAVAGDALLAACADAAMLRGNVRDALTLAERAATGDDLPSFNAGVMWFADTASLRADRDRLLELLGPDEWHAIASEHTDQAVWNRLYRDRVRLLDPRFNMMVGHAGLYGPELFEPDGDIRVLHFNGAAKPWLPGRHGSLSPRQEWAMERWRLAARAMMARRR